MPSFKLHFVAALALLLRSAVSQTTSINYCLALDEAIQICVSETPGFTALAATKQVSCLCASQLGTIPWGPSTFDLLAAKCASQYATIDVTIASDAAQLAGFCTATAAAVPTSTGLGTNTASATPKVTLQSTATSTAQNTRPSTTSFLTSPGTTSSGSGGTTIISVVTASQVSTKASNAAIHAQGRFDLLGLALPVGGMLLGGL